MNTSDSQALLPPTPIVVTTMSALGKRCLILKEKRVLKLPTDLEGLLYKNFDQMNIKETIWSSIKEWIEMDLGLTKKSEIDKMIDDYSKMLNDNNEDVREGAVKGLCEIQNETTIGPLSEALKDEYSAVRSIAVTGLGNIGTEKSVDFIIEVLQDEDAGVRGNAVYQLGEIGLKKAIPYIENLVSDNDRYWGMTVGDFAQDAIKKIISHNKSLI